MWIMMNDSFLSIVESKDKDTLLVRARVKGHIEAIFPGVKVTETKTSDYHYRTYLPRGIVARVIANEVIRITYPNFKDSVVDDDLHNAYLKCWSVMQQYQIYLQGYDPASPIGYGAYYGEDEYPTAQTPKQGKKVKAVPASKVKGAPASHVRKK